MAETENRIAAFREKLYAKPAPRKWSLSKLVTSVSGPIAIVISLATAYYTNFMTVDDVRVIIHSTPTMTVNKHGVAFDGDIKLSIFNAGNRLAVIMEAGVAVATRKSGNTPQKCAGLPNDNEIVKGHEIEQIAIEAQKMVPFVIPAIKEDPEDDVQIPIRNRKIMVCLRLHVATPDLADEIGDIVLISDLEGRPDFAGFPGRSAIGPISLFRHTGLTLFK